jgi:hypothetical protein
MFCCRVRYSLSEGTVFLVGEYGIPCRRVRYSLSEGTVFLVGEYGITLQVHLRGIIAAFAGLLSKLLSEPGRSAPRRGANLWESTVFFVGEYGIDLSAGTVLGETWRGGRSCGRVRYSSEKVVRLLKRYLWENPRFLRHSQAQESVILIRVMRITDLSEGTVFIDSESAHLLGTPVVLVGDPGNSCWASGSRASDTGRL